MAAALLVVGCIMITPPSALCSTARSIATRRCTLQLGAARAACGVCDGGGAAHRGRVPIRIGRL
jgi:hypothetical protein